MNLHLGCGYKKMQGWINVDSLEKVNPDQVVDLRMWVWPWKDNSVYAIYAHHVFEHLPDPCHIMMECWRVLEPGGTVEAVVPYAMSTLAFQDPTHVSFWTDVTPLYFVNDHEYKHKYTDHGFDLEFSRLRNQAEDAPPNSICRRLRSMIPEPVRMKLTYVLNGMFDEVHFKLRKPQAGVE
jgi:predicted SAM-dependent methyltransferase